MLTTAIKQGIDPNTTYYDGTSPMTLEIPGGGTWTVNNDEPGGGVMSLDEATWNSINVVFAQLDLDVGPEAVTETAHEMGIEATLQSLPAEAIGGLADGVTPLEMADGYATLANGGVHHDPTAISQVEFPDGKVDEIDNDEGERVLTPGQAWDVTKVLEGVITQGTGAGYTSIGCTSEAGKTGTSEEESDAWFVGYTPKYSTAVWVGHPQSREYDRLRRPDRRPDLAELHVGRRRRRMPRIRSALEPARTLGAEQRPHQGLLGSELRRRRRIRRTRRRIGSNEEAGKGRVRRRRRRSRRRTRSDSRNGPDRLRSPPARRRRHQPRLSGPILLG